MLSFTPFLPFTIGLPQGVLPSLNHITPYKLFTRLFFVEKQKLVVHLHKNVQRVFSYLYWEF